VRPDLRDSFAIHFAAALAREQRYSIEFIVGRAYDLAEAMMEERERRFEADARIAHDAGWSPAHQAGLLDDAAPPSDADSAYDDGEELLLDPSWLEPPYDPAWDSEKWRLEPTEGAESSRPGLARTQAERDEQARRRKLA